MADSRGPLHCAAKLGQDAAVCWLLDHGVPTDSRTSKRVPSRNHRQTQKAVPAFHSPLYAAIKMYKESTALILLSRGANMWFAQRESPGNQFQEAAIHCAAFRGLTAVVRHLVLTIAIDVDELDSRLETPLHHAIRQGDNQSMIKTILELGADIDKEHGSELPITTAISCQNFTNAMAFLDARPRVNISSTGPGSMSPLAVCALYIRGSLSVSENEMPALEQRMLFDQLITCGADVNAPCNGLDTPLGIAIRRGTATAVYELIKGGADIEKCTGARQLKPIDLIWNLQNTIDIAIKGTILVAAGARLDVPSKATSKTSLERAMFYESTESQPILSALLCSAGRQSFRDGYLDELLQCCLEKRSYGPAKILMHHGASSRGAKEAAYSWANEIASGLPNGSSRRDLSLCLDFQFSDEEIENLFTSALHSTNEEHCHLFIDRGVLSFSKGPKPWLHLAARYGYFSLTHRLCRAGMDLNALDDNFEPPMMIALRAEYPTIADLHFDLGADPFHPRPDSECRQSQDLPTEIISPFEYAVRHSYYAYANRWWRDSPPDFVPTEDFCIPRVIDAGDECAGFIDELRRSTRNSSKDTEEQPTRRQIAEDSFEENRFDEKIISVQGRLTDILGESILDRDWGCNDF
ncbi:Ankyrin repeat and protein kinase domain-containing protein 1 [Daldinia childiae]|uniref:Ankyrin repeat and protein kinase domain-containing protein 1 n=1 Tax=Daldinia childiae TaxID=326645 RepID=UPI0014469715|nr:Ankyrin repeat and protein kinase domain-containing protein 1 [Daldinia childiae]KAF3062075.1 Ankyrin repeat and protein kinase domain-containing protein 1 [Daldinia childiae]